MQLHKQLSQQHSRSGSFRSRRSFHSRSRAAPLHSSVLPAATVSYRTGTPEDVQFIQKRLLLESMNPLGIKPERFTVVEDANGSGIVAFAQLAPLPAPNTFEFRSLVVLPEHRGKEVGSQLMRHVVFQGASTDADIYLTTLRRTIPFYEPAGFKQASEVPWFLWFEAAAGTVVAKVAANDQLVVMRRAGRSAATN